MKKERIWYIDKIYSVLSPSIKIPDVVSNTLQKIPEKSLGILPFGTGLKFLGQANRPDSRPCRRESDRDGRVFVRKQKPSYLIRFLARI